MQVGALQALVAAAALTAGCPTPPWYPGSLTRIPRDPPADMAQWTRAELRWTYVRAFGREPTVGRAAQIAELAAAGVKRRP